VPVLGHQEVLVDGQASEEPHLLEGAADPRRGALIREKVGDVALVEQHASAVRL
jgi:hypothetical protein